MRAVRRDNPFEPLSPASLAPIYEWPGEALRFLGGDFGCLHVVAGCGMGKTTLLRQIEHRLTTEGAPVMYACIPVGGHPEPKPPANGAVALLDETDRLSDRALGSLLRRLRQAHCRCVLAGHRQQLAAIVRAGFSAQGLGLKPLVSAERVRVIFEARVVLACGPGGPILAGDAAQALLRASGGNIERCLQIGYEVFEDLDVLRTITAADIEAALASLGRALADDAASR